MQLALLLLLLLLLLLRRWRSRSHDGPCTKVHIASRCRTLTPCHCPGRRLDGHDMRRSRLLRVCTAARVSTSSRGAHSLPSTGRTASDLQRRMCEPCSHHAPSRAAPAPSSRGARAECACAERVRSWARAGRGGDEPHATCKGATRTHRPGTRCWHCSQAPSSAHGELSSTPPVAYRAGLEGRLGAPTSQAACILERSVRPRREKLRPRECARWLEDWHRLQPRGTDHQAASHRRAQDSSGAPH